MDFEGLSQSCALNPKRQRSALLVLSLPTNKDTQGFGGWRKCTSPEPSILPSKLRPNFSIVIIIALARGGYVISHSCFFFLLVFNVFFLHNMLLPICFLFFLLCWRLMWDFGIIVQSPLPPNNHPPILHFFMDFRFLTSISSSRFPGIFLGFQVFGLGDVTYCAQLRKVGSNEWECLLRFLCFDVYDWRICYKCEFWAFAFVLWKGEYVCGEYVLSAMCVCDSRFVWCKVIVCLSRKLLQSNCNFKNMIRGGQQKQLQRRRNTPNSLPGSSSDSSFNLSSLHDNLTESSTAPNSLK